MDLSGVVQTVFPKAFDEKDWYNYTKGFDFDSMVRSDNRFFDEKNFNTEIPADRKPAYQSWSVGNVTDSGFDYDYGAAFMAGESRNPEHNNHLSDIGKKPNHITFTKESIHARGEYKKFAGSWNNKGQYVPSAATLSAVNKWRASQGL